MVAYLMAGDGLTANISYNCTDAYTLAHKHTHTHAHTHIKAQITKHTHKHSKREKKNLIKWYNGSNNKIRYIFLV